MLTDDPLWFKDVVIYQLHVKSFFDANDDGVGDFLGLTQKLDYLQDLGINAIWLMPFYASPLRDDGYDIASYRNLHPSYGTMRQFRHFVREAHERGLRVITELVINHTSDQHPWFQRARRAKSGSKFRDWYVWSDNDQKYKGTRIIFTDTESSNWSWDPVAKSYYWHRFFAHQPDLNFDNPQVVRAVVSAMHFWIDAGVDGMRLDAIPYLCEREGTSNENLPETHAVLKRLRAALDGQHKNRMFLAEANQWPEDVQQYFGDGDECHMAYHFPLMPRMYMAIAQEDRHPITDIMRQTPEIPANCQWAVFLRNHDELTLEMVTDSERDYLWNTYAADRQARINLGIRRRLAPLMENDRRKIELMNSLLLSMPGTPIVYYGDEIGMGDNIFLGDRNGVRTPMQWTPDRNGGFSRTDPARLYLPPLMDPAYGYQAVNVEVQSRNSSSLLNWMKRLISARQAHQAFGRGTLTFLYPANRRILAYVREFGSEAILCVANLSRSAQVLELDLTAYKGRIPIELLGRVNFPPIGEAFYRLTMQGHSFLWFQLATAPDVEVGAAPPIDTLPEYVTLVMTDGIGSLLAGRSKTLFEREVVRQYLPLRRWYGGKDATLDTTTMLSVAPFPPTAPHSLMTVIEARFAGDVSPQRYFLPLIVDWREIHALPPQLQTLTVAKVRKGAREGTLYEAAAGDIFALDLVDHVRRNLSLDLTDGSLRFAPTAAFAEKPAPEVPTVRLLGGEQSNSSILLEDYLVIKLYRRLSSGTHPEIEMGRFLTDVAGFPNTPPLLGTVEFLDAKGVPTALACLHGFIRNQGDGWTFSLSYLERFLDEHVLLPVEELAQRQDLHAVYVTQARQLGLRTAELHRALCRADADKAFAPEPLTSAYLRSYLRKVRQQGAAALKTLADRQQQLPPQLVERVAPLLTRRNETLARVGQALPARIDAARCRIHGDYHLGQVLVAQNDFYVLDFEGEPNRSLEERREKQIALKDVAGMVRSFDYCAWTAVEKVATNHPDRRDALAALALGWRDAAVSAFLDSYRAAIAGCPAYPSDESAAKVLLELAIMEKLFYEIGYELANRPAWLRIPLASAAHLLREAT